MRKMRKHAFFSVFSFRNPSKNENSWVFGFSFRCVRNGLIPILTVSKLKPKTGLFQLSTLVAEPYGPKNETKSDFLLVSLFLVEKNWEDRPMSSDFLGWKFPKTKTWDGCKRPRYSAMNYILTTIARNGVPPTYQFTRLHQIFDEPAWLWWE